MRRDFPRSRGIARPGRPLGGRYGDLGVGPRRHPGTSGRRGSDRSAAGLMEEGRGGGGEGECRRSPGWRFRHCAKRGGLFTPAAPPSSLTPPPPPPPAHRPSRASPRPSTRPPRFRWPRRPRSSSVLSPRRRLPSVPLHFWQPTATSAGVSLRTNKNTHRVECFVGFAREKHASGNSWSRIPALV